MYAEMTGLTELPPLNRTRFATIRVVAETGSTNADLLAEAAAGEPEGLVLVTDHQTAGRGRQQRNWHDDPGNALLVSVLLRPERRLAPLMPLLAGVAAAEALISLAADRPASVRSAGLKWPNDVLAPPLDERKLAGILSESTAQGPAPLGRGPADDRLAVVVGMGMNLRWGRPPPSDIARRAATLTELLDRPVDRDEILDGYLRSLELWLRRLEGGGPTPLLDRYRQCCLTLGREVRFATATTAYTGTALDVSPSGTLLLRTDEHGDIELNAGDAHHLS